MALETSSELNENTTETTQAQPSTAVDDSPSSEIVPKKQASEIANVVAGMTTFINTAEAQGNTGMTLNRMSFPVIALDGAEFTNTTEDSEFALKGADLSKEFLFRPMSWHERVVYIFTPAGEEEGDWHVLEKDGITTHKGDTVEELKIRAEAEGASLVRKVYVDYIVSVFDPKKDKKAEKPLGLVILSLPPSATGRVAGAIFEYQGIKGVLINDPTKVVLKANVGKKKQAKKGSYYPWEFEVETLLDGAAI